MIDTEWVRLGATDVGQDGSWLWFSDNSAVDTNIVAGKCGDCHLGPSHNCLGIKSEAGRWAYDDWGCENDYYSVCQTQAKTRKNCFLESFEK